MSLPYLLNPTKLKRTTPQDLRRHAVRETGELASFIRDNSKVEENLFSLVRAELWGTWCTFLLLETGLLPKDHAARSKIIDLLPPKLPSAPFLENLPNLPELKERLENDARFSAALAPLDGTEGNLSPGTLAIWRLDEDENPYQFPEKADTHISGDSAQLATQLTQAALTDGSKTDPIRLASEWIITGALDRNRVREVRMGNKTSLRLDRRWLLPKANSLSEKPEFWREWPRYAETLKEAKDTVNGDLQTRIVAPESWPGKVSRLISFTGKSVRPLIAATLLSKPNCLHLLYSSNSDSIRSIEVLEAIIGEFLPETRIEKTKVPSDSISHVQTLLEKEILSKSDKETSLFNVTNGNFLMRGAILLSFRKAPGLRLIYKDFDNTTATEFTQITYKGEEEYETGIIAGSRDCAGNVNWDELLEWDKGPDKEPGHELLNKLKKNGSS